MSDSCAQMDEIKTPKKLEARTVPDKLTLTYLFDGIFFCIARQSGPLREAKG